MAPGILRTVAEHVRARRREQGLSQAALARHSGLSVRFLARVESGEGNISVLRLEALARALGSSTHELTRPARDAAEHLALVGLRGAGKSTIGPPLARELGMAFVEIDQQIVDASGLPLDQLFELHGEPYYRRLEREILNRLLAAADPIVLAASGGVVNDPLSWRVLRERSTVVWLRARAEDHWKRVVAQGDRRPMADNPAAMDELRALFQAREALYSQSHVTVDTAARTPREIMLELVRRLRAADGPVSHG